jgi:hypothetical protein
MSAHLPPPISVAPAPIEDSVRGLLKALDAGDRAAVHSYGPSKDTRFSVVVFDYDWNNAPMTVEGIDDAHKFFDTLLDIKEKEHLKVVSKLSDLHTGCSGPELGFATFVLTQTFPVGGETQTSKYALTALLSYDRSAQKWRLFHWHATLISSE